MTFTAPAPPPAVTASSPPEPRPEMGWCVRLEWRDGTHDLSSFSSTEEKATARAQRARRYWFGPPDNLLAGSWVVPVSRTAYVGHPRTGCHDAGCPR